MERQIVRLTFSVFLAALLWAATTSVYAEDGPKQKAHGAYSTCNELLWPGVIDQTFFHFNFQEPDKGYFDYYSFSGPWAGSWAETEVQELFFGTYNGSAANIVGRPVVYYWSRASAGEEIFDGAYPGVLPDYQRPYQNIEGWFRVGGMVDGGPGHENDVVFPSIPIPPEGLDWVCDAAGICGNGETQAQTLYYLLTNGFMDPAGFGYGGIVTGNISIKNR